VTLLQPTSDQAPIDIRVEAKPTMMRTGATDGYLVSRY